MRASRFFVEFHNAEANSREADLWFDLTDLPSRTHVFLQFSFLRTTLPISDSIEGVSAIIRPTIFEILISFVFEWIMRRPPIALDRTKYLAIAPCVVKLKGVLLEPGGWCAARLSLYISDGLLPGAQHQIEVQQIVKLQVAGGSTFILKGAPSVRPIKTDMPSQSELAEIESGAEDGYLPPWLLYLREKNNSKRRA